MLTFVKDLWIRRWATWKWHMFALVKCDCWNEKEIRKSHFKKQQSCWCALTKSNKDRATKIEIWFKPEWSKLTFIEILKNWKVKCSCECWKEKILIKWDFLSCNTKSCWCVYKLRDSTDFWWIKKNKRIRQSIEYIEWRTKCFERDDYICQISWEKWELVVHHLYPFYEQIIDISIEDYPTCTFLFNLDNWITISKKLHLEFHKIYWFKNFTIENFYEFKNNYLLTKK